MAAGEHVLQVLRALLLVMMALATPAFSQGDLRGHGGPVRALSVAGDGAVAISGSFDSRAILWSLERGDGAEAALAWASAAGAAAVASSGTAQCEPAEIARLHSQVQIERLA